jgi:hypothetical protein
MSISRLAQAVVLGALLATANLAGMPASPTPRANPHSPTTTSGHPPKARSGRPGTSTGPRPVSKPSLVMCGGRPLRARSGSPGILE